MCRRTHLLREHILKKSTHSGKRTHSRLVQWSDRVVVHLDHGVGAFQEGEAVQVACAEEEVINSRDDGAVIKLDTAVG